MEIPIVAKPRNPNAKLYTVQIPQELIGYLKARSSELDLSMPQYVARLIREDSIHQGTPRVDYPIHYSGPVMQLKATDSTRLITPKKSKK